MYIYMLYVYIIDVHVEKIHEHTMYLRHILTRRKVEMTKYMHSQTIWR